MFQKFDAVVKRDKEKKSMGQKNIRSLVIHFVCYSIFYDKKLVQNLDNKGLYWDNAMSKNYIAHTKQDIDRKIFT